MKKDNQKFEETGAFLDLMSKKERKRWEKEQAKLKEKIKEEKESEIENTKLEIEEIKEDVSVENSIAQEEEKTVENTDDLYSSADTIPHEELESELEKTKQLLNLTQEIEIVQNNSENNQEINEEDDEIKFFNPVIPLGFILILLFALFIFSAMFTKYDNSTFLTINGVILLSLTFFFGLTSLSNYKHVKAFAIFDLIIILGLIIFNGISITNYDSIYNKTDDINPIVEEEKKEEEHIVIEDEEVKLDTNEYICSSEDETLTITITEKDNYITYINKIEKFSDEQSAEKISVLYQNIEGIETNLNNNILTIKFDFNNLDIEQYKSVIEKHNEYYKLETEFNYINKNKIEYDKYIEFEMKNLNCVKS